jgi:hypothetical protein
VPWAADGTRATPKENVAGEAQPTASIAACRRSIETMIKKYERQMTGAATRHSMPTWGRQMNFEKGQVMSGAAQSIRCGISALALVAGVGIGLMGPVSAGEMAFTVTIEQLTTEQTLKLPDGSTARAPISPGTAVVHRGANPMFTVGEPASPGLQRQAEAGQPEDLLAAMKAAEGVSSTVMFDRTDTFTIMAEPGEVLTFATMFGQSNDCFYAPKGGDIRLFDRNGQPIMGERTVEVVLYDAGTEVNQAPGVGPDQGPRQDPNTWRQGELEHATVQPVRDMYAYPPVGEVIRVTVSTGKSA